MLVYLVGFMASGKSKLGKQIATKLNFNFIDLDKKIAEKYSLSINDIFEKFGEQFFRIEEQNQLHKTTALKNTIVAVGGGTPCFFNNIDVMNHYGNTVYLKIGNDLLFERLKEGKAKRPILKDKEDDELLEFIENMLATRSIYYQAAKYIFKGSNNFNKNTEALIELLDLNVLVND